MDTRPLRTLKPRIHPSTWTKNSFILFVSGLIVVLAACDAGASGSTASPFPTSGQETTGTAVTPSPAPNQGSNPSTGGGAQPSDTGTPAQPPIDQSTGSGSTGAALAPLRQYQWVGTVVVSDLEGRHLDLQRGCDSWVLIAQAPDLTKKLESNIGKKVIIWGTAFRGVSIYQRQAISVQAAFGPNDPMPMTLVAVPEYPCPGQPLPPQPIPVPPVPAIDLQPGEIEARGKLLIENGAQYLDTPSGRILLIYDHPTPVPPPRSESGSAAGGSGIAQPGVIALVQEYLVVGKWLVKNNQLTITVRLMTPFLVPVPPPIATPPAGKTPVPGPYIGPTTVPPAPGKEQGYITGVVKIGPLCPVEPCRNPAPDVYSSRVLILQNESGQAMKVALNADGSFKTAVTPGTYTVTLSNCQYMGCSRSLPKTVTIGPNQVVALTIDIDTGIR